MEKIFLNAELPLAFYYTDEEGRTEEDSKLIVTELMLQMAASSGNPFNLVA